MITYEDARLFAQRLLDASPISLVITGAQQFDGGWVFFYDSCQHQQTGNLTDALAGNGLILVEQETGQVHLTGTARPVEEYIDQYLERKRRVREGWPENLDDRFVQLLALVGDGMGLRDARHLDLLLNSSVLPREHATVLDELVELEKRGLVRRRPGGPGYKWEHTDEGHAAVLPGGSLRP